MTLKLVARSAAMDLKALRAQFSLHGPIVGLVVGAMLGWFFFRLTSNSVGTLPLMMSIGSMWGLVGAVVWELFLKDLGLIAPVAMLFGEARPAADFGLASDDWASEPGPAPVEIEMPQPGRRAATTVAELRQRQVDAEESAFQPEMASV